MKAQSTKQMIALAALGHGPLSRVAATAVEAGIVVPSVLRSALERAGYAVTYHEGPGEDSPEGKHPHGSWVQVRKVGPAKVRHQGADAGEPSFVEVDGPVVARAYSHDDGDALLQAVYGAMREEDAAVVVDEELAKRGHKVSLDLRQALESHYITRGGLKNLQANLDAFPPSK